MIWSAWFWHSCGHAASIKHEQSLLNAVVTAAIVTVLSAALDALRRSVYESIGKAEATLMIKPGRAKPCVILSQNLLTAFTSA